MGTSEGVGDRMRSAAFAELQAIAAFLWAADHFQDAPRELRDSWRNQAADETRHYNMIIKRMEKLGHGVTDRSVSTALWASLAACTSGREFCIKIAAAEERGRLAGIKLVEHLENTDPGTAAVFREIAADEVAHVALAATWFDWTPE